MAVGDKLIKLSGPIGARCMAKTPDGDIVVKKVLGGIYLKKKYNKTLIECVEFGSKITIIDLNRFSMDNEFILHMNEDGTSYSANLH